MQMAMQRTCSASMRTARDGGGRRPPSGGGWAVGLLLALVQALPIRAQDAATDAGAAAVVATVGNSPIFQAELDAIVQRIESAQPAAAVSTDGTGTMAGDRRQQLAAAALETLVDERLLRAEIDRRGITVRGGEIDERLARLQKQLASRGLDWETFLRRAGRDEQGLREQISFEIGLDKLIRPQLTEATITAAFDRRRREVDGTRLRVSHIVLRPDLGRGEPALVEQLAKADEIRRDILQGAMPFAEAARRYSAGPSRGRGGDIGWISRTGPMTEEFAKRSFALAKGDISKPFVTPFGIHLVQVTAVEPGRVGLDVVRPKIEAVVAAEVLRETVGRLRKMTPIEYAAGVPHFDPATGPDDLQPRKVVLGGSDPAG